MTAGRISDRRADIAMDMDMGLRLAQGRSMGLVMMEACRRDQDRGQDRDMYEVGRKSTTV
jgi:hypothetical protein